MHRIASVNDHNPGITLDCSKLPAGYKRGRVNQKVSLVIPVYNEADHLLDFLQAIDALKFPIEKELIIVDDRSSDNSLQIMLARQAQLLGKRQRFRARLNHLEAVCQLVGLGIGVSIIPRIAAQRHARALKVKSIPLTDTWANRHMLICFREFDALPVLAQLLVEHLRGKARA